MRKGAINHFAKASAAHVKTLDLNLNENTMAHLLAYSCGLWTKKNEPRVGDVQTD